jgi:hypothetical protein
VILQPLSSNDANREALTREANTAALK